MNDASNAAVADKRAGHAGAKVTVACKLPHGIILRGFLEREERELVMGGGVRETKVFRPTGERQVVHGSVLPFGAVPPYPIVGGYALTENVSKDLWDSWVAVNKDAEIVKRRLIFAYENPNKASDEARSNVKELSGFEPIDPDNPGKRMKGIEKANPKEAA